ncbi:MAG: hypothetical protein AAGF89_07550 [Bacteroidota bacterium]
MNAKLTVSTLLIVLSFWSCTGDEELPPPDVSNVNAPLEVLRFDRSLMALDTGQLLAGLQALDQEYGEFADVYLTHIIPLRRGDFSPEEQTDIIKAFLTFPLVKEIDQEVQLQFPATILEEQRQALQQALRYYRYYLPAAPVPDTLVAYLAQFELAGFLYGDGNLAVGLDFFLGPGYNYEAVDPREPIFSSYLTRSYTPEHLSTKLMRVLISDYLPAPRSGRLIDYLIYEGKILYLLNRVLPEVPDHVIHEVSEEEMTWLWENEIRIYAHLQKERQLYETNADLIRKLTQPAPSSPGMPAESPGQAVNYLGEQIVAAYVKANPRVSMEELLRIEDGQQILAGARYKPK